MKKVPWTDYEGNEIKEGDTIQHPDGDKAKVVYDSTRDRNLERWRAVYEDDTSLWLGRQIGAKGQAIVI